MSLLEVTGLDVWFDTPEGRVHAVSGMDLSLKAGETVAIVGESGSGKSQSVLALMGLLASNGTAQGRALFKGQELLGRTNEELNLIRGAQIAMVFQDPMTSLNPHLTIARQMTEVLELHDQLSSHEARVKSIEMLERVQISDAARRIDRYPHEFSGGMRQRVMIAMALLCGPDLLIADEPTTALDVTVQAQINQMIAELNRESGTSVILITHDLGVVAGLCDKVIVLYAGEVVEVGTVQELFYRPRHPYSAGLLDSVPRLDEIEPSRLTAIPGNPPNLLHLSAGCYFHDRCGQKIERCVSEHPLLESTGEGSACRCFAPRGKEERDKRVSG